jgi:Tfp pilus assembly protein PilN
LTDSISLTHAAALLVQAPADGLALNTLTLAVVTGIVVALVGAITFLFRLVTSSQRQQIDALTKERDAYLDQLLDTMRTADRSTDAADQAARMLTDRRPMKKR